MKSFSLITIAFILFLSGCSSKKYFEPENTIGDFNSHTIAMGETISTFSHNGATLDDGTIVTSNGILNSKTLPKGFNLLNIDKGIVIAANNTNKLLINKNSNILTFDKNTIAATIMGNLLAIVFIDNSIALYDLDTNKIIFKEYYNHSYLNDIKIANPIFMDDIVLFPTLDGKVIVVNYKSKKVVRNIVVSISGDIKNIIFLDVVNETLVIASSSRVITLGEGSLKSAQYDISAITVSDSSIYLATIDGTIIQLDLSLNELQTKKFKFARFFTLAYSNSIYALESQGYLIDLTSDFNNYKVYDFDFNNEEYVLSIKDKIFFEDKYISIK